LKLRSNNRLSKEVESGLLSVSAASRKYQISGSVIDRWRRQARQGGLDTAPSARERSLERENREIKERLAELYLEVDHLTSKKREGELFASRKLLIFRA